MFSLDIFTTFNIYLLNYFTHDYIYCDFKDVSTGSSKISEATFNYCERDVILYALGGL